MTRPAATSAVVHTTLTSAFADIHRRFDDKVAIVEPGGSSMTYGELGGRARRLASGLAAQGMKPGDRAIVVTPNRSECFLIDHALAIGGFVRVALSFRLHAKEIADIAADCTPLVAFVDPAYEEQIAAAFAAKGLPTTVIAIGEPSAGGLPLGELLQADELSELPDVDPEDVAWLPYTSGTTGRPKGVMLSHRSVVACARNLMVELDAAQSDDVVLHVAPLTHLSGYVALPYTFRGASHICAREFEVTEALSTIAQHGVTVLPAVPTMLNMMLPELETGRWSTETLHTVLYGGSAIAPDRLMRLVACLGDVFVQGYGLTEVPFPLASLAKHDHRFDPDHPVPARLSAAGRVNPFVQVRLVDLDGSEVADGEEGEIQARGDTTMSGYWNNPDATAEMLLADGWASTGDVGRFKDGFLHVVDRKKDMIVSGGFNIYPAEIEAAIAALEGVDEVAVIGVPDERWGETVKAVIVRRDGFSVTEEDVDRVCRERIATYKRPRLVEFIAEIPKTGTGKIQRHVLRSQAWANSDRRVGG